MNASYIYSQGRTFLYVISWETSTSFTHFFLVVLYLVARMITITRSAAKAPETDVITANWLSITLAYPLKEYFYLM